MVLTIVLEPQLAVKLRAIAQENAETGRKIFYRLALGGLLIGLVWTLLQWSIIISGVHFLLTARQVMLIAAATLYLLDFALLNWAVLHSKLLSSDISNVLQLAALFIPLLFIPW